MQTKLTKELKKKQKENKLKHLNAINKQSCATCQNNNVHIPHLMVCNIAVESKELCPCITWDIVNHSFKTFKNEQQLKESMESNNPAAIPENLGNDDR